jgi:hypothetical protein
MAQINAAEVIRIIGEINQAGEKSRRQELRRRSRIYKDGGKEYLISYITKEFGRDAVNQVLD